MWYDTDPDGFPLFDINVEEADIPFTQVAVDPGNAELIRGIRESYPDFDCERIVAHLKHVEGITVTYDEVRSVLTPR